MKAPVVKELQRELDQRDATIVALVAEVDALKAEAAGLRTTVDSLRVGLREVRWAVTSLLDPEGDSVPAMMDPRVCGAVLDLLSDIRSMRAETIAAHLDEDVEAPLRALEAHGFVVRNDDGSWSRP